MTSKIFMQICEVIEKKEFTLQANDQAEVSKVSCWSLPKMLKNFWLERFDNGEEWMCLEK